MAKNTPKTKKLSFTDIVLNAEAEIIQQAYEARIKIDELLIEREKAYEQIAALEEQVDEIIGEASIFPFPEPPLPVSGFNFKTPQKKVVKKVIKPEPVAEIPEPVKEVEAPVVDAPVEDAADENAEGV